MSKAGVVGQFGSKLELQLQAFELARDRFTDEVWRPARRVPPGLRRLRAVCENWARYAGDPPFAGGCLLVTAAVEFDDQPGPLRDAVADALRAWRAQLTADIETAVRHGELRDRTDARRLAYTLEALAARAQPAISLLGDDNAGDLCREAMLEALTVHATEAGREVLSVPPEPARRRAPSSR
jgi:hypothetical protein